MSSPTISGRIDLRGGALSAPLEPASDIAAGWGATIGLTLLALIATLNESSFRIGDSTEGGFDQFHAARLAVCAGCGMFGIYYLRQTIDMLLGWPGLWSVLFASWALLTSVVAVSPLHAIASSGALWCMILFAPALAQRLPARQILITLTIALMLFIAVAWVVSLIAPDLGQPEIAPEEVTDGYRLGGITHPNGLGRQASLAIAMLLLLGAEKLVSWRWILAPLVLSAATLLLTDSRTAMLSTAAAVGLIAWRRLSPGAILGLASLAIVVGVLAIGLRESSLSLAGLSRSGDSSEVYNLTGRTDLWQFVIGKIETWPVTGCGYGCGRFIINEGHTWLAYHSHNLLLDVTLGTGLFGGVLLLGMMFSQLWALIRQPDLFPDIITAMVCVGSLTETIMFTSMPQTFTLLWLVALFWRGGQQARQAVDALLASGETR